MKEKRITLFDRMNWHYAWAEYFEEVIESNRHSTLCGLPAREYTEVTEDLETGDIIIRYKEATTP